MIDEAAAITPFWMLLAAILAFRMGYKVGDSRRHRNCLDEANQDLRDQLRRIHSCQSHPTPNPTSSEAPSSE